MLKQVTLSLLLVFTIMSASVVSAQTVPVSKVIPTDNTSYEVPKPNDLNDTKTKGISPYSPSEKAKMPPTTTPAEGAPTPTAEVTPSSLTSDTASTDSSAATQPATTTDPSATAQETDQTTTSSATCLSMEAPYN